MLFAHSVVIAQNSYQLYVGERKLLKAPNPPNNGALFQTAWGSSGSHLSLDTSTLSAYVTATEYFTGTEQVQCDYYWYWYDNYGYQHTNHATTYYNISCKPVEIRLSDTYVTMNVGDTKQLTYTLTPSNVYPQPIIRFISSDNTVCAVNENGYLFAEKPGPATITVKNNAGPDAVCYVTVQSIEPTSIRIPYNASTYVGESTSISYSLDPSNARTNVSWYCNPTYVAQVSDGTIYGNDEGTATVYCITDNGLRSNDCTVSVKYRTATGVKVSDNTLYVPIGETRSLSWTPVPSNARTSVTWKSEDESVAQVSQSGQVSGIKEGTTNIIVTTDNGHSAICAMTVPPNPTKIELPQRISVYRSEARTMQPKMTPQDAYQSLTWKSSDNNVATISSDGKVIAVNPGTATITVTTHNGKTTSCRVDVPEPDFNLYLWQTTGEKVLFPLDEHPVISENDGNLLVKTKSSEIEIASGDIKKLTIKDERTNDVPTAISLPSKLEMNYRDKAKLGYTLYPTEYDIDTKVTWETSNKYVAQVNSNGEVYANLPGECVITATTSNGRTDECHVTVADHDFYLILWFKNGDKNSVRLAEYPKVTYADDKIIVTTFNTEYSYTATEVRKMTLCDSEDGNDMDGIENVCEDGHNGRDISLTHGTPGSKLCIYNASGNLLEQYTVDTDGRLRYSLDSYPSGIYIIKSGEITYKIIKR